MHHLGLLLMAKKSGLEPFLNHDAHFSQWQFDTQIIGIGNGKRDLSGTLENHPGLRVCSLTNFTASRFIQQTQILCVHQWFPQETCKLGGACMQLKTMKPLGFPSACIHDI